MIIKFRNLLSELYRTVRITLIAGAESRVILSLVKAFNLNKLLNIRRNTNLLWYALVEALQRAGRVPSELRLALVLYFVLELLITRRPPPRARWPPLPPAARVQRPMPAFPSARSSRRRLWWWLRLALVLLGRDVLEHSRALLAVLDVGLGIVGVALLGCRLERMLALPPTSTARALTAASKSSHTQHCSYRGSLLSTVLSSLLLFLYTWTGTCRRGLGDRNLWWRAHCRYTLIQYKARPATLQINKDRRHGHLWGLVGRRHPTGTSVLHRRADDRTRAASRRDAFGAKRVGVPVHAPSHCHTHDLTIFTARTRSTRLRITGAVWTTAGTSLWKHRRLVRKAWRLSLPQFVYVYFKNCIPGFERLKPRNWAYTKIMRILLTKLKYLGAELSRAAHFSAMLFRAFNLALWNWAHSRFSAAQILLTIVINFINCYKNHVILIYYTKTLFKRIFKGICASGRSVDLNCVLMWIMFTHNLQCAQSRLRLISTRGIKCAEPRWNVLRTLTIH